MMPSILGLITARGGSKGIPQKNTVELAGKPLISYSIETAINSGMLEKVVVSTDDDEIANISRQYGAYVPFLRPSKFAQDKSPHIDSLVHAITWFNDNEKWQPDYIMLLQPTSPLRLEKDITNAIDLCIKKNADSVISVNKVNEHPYFMKKINRKGVLLDFIKKPNGYLPRQTLSPVYYENGAIYLVRTKIITKKRIFYTNRTYAYIMPLERSLDINTSWDLSLAELILTKQK